MSHAEFDALADSRMQERQAMNNPAQWGPFTGDGYYPVNDEQLADTLVGADIVIAEDRFTSFAYMEGYLSPERGSKPFFAIKDRTPGEVHLLSVPGANE
ncbi:hypothetical protein [Ralstonia soli]|uniref:Uncharacterized protein n=1 Tax=Ralstonia soli TaxID=2953896 RepID=A0ABT1AIT8_9RALS|nr:hypothetical protein [Ralstonia soli]MCO5398332.1 hypothetical protein [Ralstonia soli]